MFHILIINAMKKLNNLSVVTALMLIIFSAQAVFAGPSGEKRKGGPQEILIIRGKVVDKETRLPLVFASVIVKETNVATVTNIDGEFIIKIC